jgi:transcriptional regulator with PAS, ATPase and Fis domain
MANIVPVKVNESIVGTVTTIQDVTHIQVQEQKIRRMIWNKGYHAKYTFSNLIGKSEIIKNVIEWSKKLSRAKQNILIIAETGTGKEMFAQSIHNYSQRGDKPFVAINCGGFPENLIDSELFGYVEGAFTGALKVGKQGLFEIAHEGTIFLDEIGELSLSLQSKLLRVIQEREIRKIGDDKIIPIDVRIIAATNKDLSDMVQKGEFRQDLYYRLNVLNLSIPPLRERKEDIKEIALSFLGLDKDACLLDDIEETMCRYNWPGNIRELQNICERILVLFGDGEKISCGNDFRIQPNELIQIIGRNNYEMAIEDNGCKDLSHNLLRINEEKSIRDALELCGQNKVNAAKKLGISRSTLWRKIAEYNIE